jgi:uncharacterized membrane protein YidH (DUF202 family)
MNEREMEALEAVLDAERTFLGALRGGLLAVAVGVGMVQVAGASQLLVTTLGGVLALSGTGAMLAVSVWYERWRTRLSLPYTDVLPAAVSRGVPLLLAGLSLFVFLATLRARGVV